MQMGKNSIGKYLSIARRAHAALIDEKLKPYNISHGQLFLLIQLYKEDGVYQQTLCEAYNLNKAGVGRSIKKLAAKNLIKKAPDPKDKRRKLIYLTERAEELKPKFYSLLKEVETQVRENLSNEEIDDFLHIIKKICTNLEVEVEE